MEATKNRSIYKIILLCVIAALGFALLNSFVVSERLEAYEQTVRTQLSEQSSHMLSLATITARNGADKATESIVPDCAVTNRVRFDTLLGELDGGLSAAELRELDSLFPLCAGLYAQRKAAMVAQLQREVQVYENYVAQLAALTARDEADRQQVTVWQELVRYETAQSEAAAELVIAQKDIIDTLLDGKSATSEEMMVILNGVRETREAQLFAHTQAASIREQLTNE